MGSGLLKNITKNTNLLKIRQHILTQSVDGMIF
jgi:hypothetical protein